MSVIIEPAVFRRAREMLETKRMTVNGLSPEPSVALVTGGAVIGFDDQVTLI